MIHTSPSDNTRFHGILVEHIHKILQMRDEQRPDLKEWVTTEAMNAKGLQHGGTFRNVLSRKVDDVVVPMFAEILASIDRNYNLDLIDPKSENTSLSQFWLNVFSDPEIMEFSYTSTREQVPGLGGRKAGEDFQCQLPFSWLIYDAVDSQWNNAKSIAGKVVL